MNFRFLTLTLSLLVTGLISAQYSGQIATNMSAGGAAQGATAGSIATLLGPVNEALEKRSKEWEDFQGSPYVSNDFQKTEVYYKEEKVGSIYYRYNALNEEVEIKETPLQPGIRALGRDKNISLMIQGKPMSFKTFIDVNGNTMNGYLTHLVDGKTYDLYKRIHVKFTEGSPAQNSFVKAIPSRFSQFIEYYVQKKGVNRVDELTLKNRQLYKIAGAEEKDKIKTFLKDYDIDLNEEKDLIKTFEFLNL
ncbi:hypothetical protein [Robiginitalea sp. IMCC43444]|uniref:hypothetical protein n=1 Tax=Robiginitalea sp. IMCC43444 TaxID=3459121 RepID=UPI004041A05C